jgi:hypothetical protein
MSSVDQLPEQDLQAAHQAATVLVIDFKAYTPRGGLLRLLLSQFRDDLGARLGLDPEPLPARGHDRHTLDELTSAELAIVGGATAVLAQDRFTGVMGDPALPRLLGEFHEDLARQRAERDQLRASLTS